MIIFERHKEQDGWNKAISVNADETWVYIAVSQCAGFQNPYTAMVALTKDQSLELAQMILRVAKDQA